MVSGSNALTNLFSEQNNSLIIVIKFYVPCKSIFLWLGKKINLQLVLTAFH